MMFEGNRLISFLTWPPNANAYAFQLARSGFYHSGHLDEVICFACEGRIRDWQKKDDPMQKHSQQFPSCPFVCGQVAGVNLTLPNLDDEDPISQLMKRVDKVVEETSKTNRILAAQHRTSEMTNMTASTTPGRIMDRPVMGVTRSAIDFLQDEKERMKTFEGSWCETWPVSPKALAQAGFFYCGPEDMVQCAWCYGQLHDWERGDNPLVEHAYHFPACPKFGDRKAVNASSLVSVHNTQGGAGTNQLSKNDLGIVTVRPRHPQFAIEASRLKSYNRNWPSNLTQTPDLLSSAGFFYLGRADKVKCFFCDGGLCDWEVDDEPWTEHARWFPNCGFLKQVKGTTFIQKVEELGKNGGPLTSMGDENRKATPTSTSAASANNESPSRSLTTEQKREVRAAMRTPWVAKALETGIPQEAIKIAIEEQLLAVDRHFREYESLIEAALLANDRLVAQPQLPPIDERLLAVDRWTMDAKEYFNRIEEYCKFRDEWMDGWTMDVKRNEGPDKSKTHKKQKTKESPPPPQAKMDENPKVPPGDDAAPNMDTNSNGADAKLLEECIKLRDEKLCKICMYEEVSVVLLPCGHLVSCVKCSIVLSDCPICRRGIKGTVRAYIA